MANPIEKILQGIRGEFRMEDPSQVSASAPPEGPRAAPRPAPAAAPKPAMPPVVPGPQGPKVGRGKGLGFGLSHEGRPSTPAQAPATDDQAEGAPTAADEPPTATGSSEEPSWLKESRKLIPGEALAGYLSFGALAAAADDKEKAKVVLALVFCLVTIVLRWYGSQEPEERDAARLGGAPRAAKGRSVQIGVVVISTLSYIFLVYSTGGQIFWHKAIVNQVFYAQVLAAALGILGPTLYRQVFGRPGA